MELIEIVGWMTQLATIGLFATGIGPCWYMLKTGSVRGVPFIFFLINSVNNAMSVYYGGLIENDVIRSINQTGLILNVGYILAYLYVTNVKRGPLLMVCVALVWLACLSLYLSTFVPLQSDVIMQLGIMLCIINVILNSTPAFEVADCIKRGTAEDMSLLMLVGMLSCSSLWLLYGVLLKSFVVYLPNFPGIATNLCKIGVLWIYGRAPIASHMKDD